MQNVTQFLSSNIKIIIILLSISVLAYCQSRGLNTSYNSSIEHPIITVEDASLCTVTNNEWLLLEQFTNQEEQYVCGIVLSSSDMIRLTLIVQKKDDPFYTAFADANEFRNGFFSFPISPKLASGIYTATIQYARRTLAEIQFTVTNE